MRFFCIDQIKSFNLNTLSIGNSFHFRWNYWWPNSECGYFLLLVTFFSPLSSFTKIKFTLFTNCVIRKKKKINDHVKFRKYNQQQIITFFPTKLFSFFTQYGFSEIHWFQQQHSNINSKYTIKLTDLIKAYIHKMNKIWLNTQSS